MLPTTTTIQKIQRNPNPFWNRPTLADAVLTPLVAFGGTLPVLLHRRNADKALYLVILVTSSQGRTAFETVSGIDNKYNPSTEVHKILIIRVWAYGGIGKGVLFEINLTKDTWTHIEDNHESLGPESDQHLDAGSPPAQPFTSAEIEEMQEAGVRLHDDEEDYDAGDDDDRHRYCYDSDDSAMYTR